MKEIDFGNFALSSKPYNTAGKAFSCFMAAVGTANIINGVALYVGHVHQMIKDRENKPKEETKKEKALRVLSNAATLSFSLACIGTGIGSLEYGCLGFYRSALPPHNEKIVVVESVEPTTTVENN